MAKINLNKALKLKKRIASDMAKIREKILKYNSFNAKNDRSEKYDVEDLKAEYIDMMNGFISLKALINSKNSTIQADLYRIDEYKGLLSMYKRMPTKEGFFTEYGDNDQQYKVQISETEIDVLIKETEDLIEKTQDKIDKFNYNNEIEFELG